MRIKLTKKGNHYMVEYSKEEGFSNKAGVIYFDKDSFEAAIAEAGISKSNGKSSSDNMTIKVEGPRVELWAAKYSEDGKKKLQEITLKGYTVSEVHRAAREIEEKLGLSLKDMGMIISEETENNSIEGQEQQVLEAIKRYAREDKKGAAYLQILKATGIDEDTLEEILNNLIEKGLIIEPKIGRFMPA